MQAEGDALHRHVGEEHGGGQVRIAVPETEVEDVLLGEGEAGHGVVDRHAQHVVPLTAQEDTATADESLEGGDDVEVDLQVPILEAETEADRLCLDVLTIELQYLEKILRSGLSVIHVRT